MDVTVQLEIFSPVRVGMCWCFSTHQRKRSKDKQKKDQRKILYNRKTIFLNHLNLGIQLI